MIVRLNLQEDMDGQQPDPYDLFRVVDTSTGRYSDFDKDVNTLNKLIEVNYGGDLLYTITEHNL